MLGLLKFVAASGFGLAALASALFYTIHKQWIQLQVFSQLTSEQTYDAFRLSLILAFLAFVILAILQAGTGKGSIRTIAKGGSTAVTNTGSGTINVNKDR